MGILYTNSDLGPALTALNRDYYGRNTWDNMYGQVGHQTDINIGQLNKNYEQTLAQAYASSQQAEQAVLGTQFGDNFKDLALYQNRQALQSAFEQYRQNYLQGVSEINSTASGAIGEVSNLKNEYTTNLTNYGNAHIDYLSWLYEQNPDAFDLIDYQQFLQDGALKSTEALSAMIYDANGNITTEGQNILKQIRNNNRLDKAYLFDNYLKQSDQKLYDWAHGQDQYNFNSKLSNAGTFQSLTGVDDLYSWRNAVSKETLDSNFSEFTTNIDNIYREIDDMKGKHGEVWNEGFAHIDGQVELLKQRLINLGIDAEKDLKIDWTIFDNYVNTLKNIYDNPKDNQNDTWNNKKVVRKVAALTYANAFKRILHRIYEYFNHGDEYALKDGKDGDISATATNYKNGVLIGDLTEDYLGALN